MRLLRRLRALCWRLLGLASREDITALTAQVDRLVRGTAGQHERSDERGKRVDKHLARLVARVEELQAQVGSSTRGLDGRVRHVERNVNALVRRQYVDQDALAFPHSVLSQRFHLWSQNEEDGITLALFKLVGTTTRRFVELGAGVNGGNCGMLAEVCGWSGLMVDGSPARAEKLEARFGRFGVRTASAWITTESVNALVREHGLAGDIDLFSLDIDGSDYWVWDSLEACSPRVVIVEFNPAFGSKRAVTVQYDPAFDRHRFKRVTPHFYGASLEAFTRLGRKKGYRLVLVEPRGANAYFLRDDVAGDIPAASPERVHPSPAADPQPLFDLIARERLPLVDFDSSDA